MMMMMMRTSKSRSFHRTPIVTSREVARTLFGEVESEPERDLTTSCYSFFDRAPFSSLGFDLLSTLYELGS
jgi:hypothetical protein